MKQSKINNRFGESGSQSVEFMIAFALMFFCLIIAIEFVFLAVGGELMSYASYMGSRSLKVNDFANVPRVVKKIAPFVAADSIEYGVNDSTAYVRINSRTAPVAGKDAPYSLIGEMKIDAFSSMVIDRPQRKECEDNPLWYVKGDIPCT